MANLPKILKDFRVYVNGLDGGANVVEIVLQKLTEKIEDIKLGHFSVGVVMGIEKLEVELSLLGHDLNMWKSHGAKNNVDGNLITFRGYQEDNNGSVDEIRIEMRGRFSEIDMGSLKKGDKSSHKIKGSLESYKYVLNGTTYYEIEPSLNRFIVDGVDMLAQQNKALGI